MNEYTIFARVPSAHPRWHVKQTGLLARSRTDALRQFGVCPGKRQASTVWAGVMYLAWRSDNIDFDYRKENGTVCVRGGGFKADIPSASDGSIVVSA